MATKKTVVQKTTGKQGKSPAQVLREQKSKIAEGARPDDPAYIRRQLAKLSDQLAVAIMEASQADDHEMVDVLVPAFATLWSTRMELNSIGGAS